MVKLQKPRGLGKATVPVELPLFNYAERRRWEAALPAARFIRRRVGIQSASLAHAIAELAGLATEDR